MKRIPSKDLPETKQALVNAARQAMRNAYCPLSKFHVGAALLTRDGKIICGTNLETAGYESIHAECAALAAANTQGYRTFVSLALVTQLGDEQAGDGGAPCGTCRQRLHEFSEFNGGQLEIILGTAHSDAVSITSIAELLPYAFGFRDIAVDLSEFKNS
jgi:cytidine deaminase